MSVRIHIKNFQSITNAELVIDRFTVVTGANNSGKTALIRAVQGVFSNTSGDAFVRHGADKLSVKIIFDDGQSVRWEKGPKVKPTYIVAGKTLHPGRAVPDEVAALGVRPIQVGLVPVWPQVAQQFTGQVFLLDLPGSNIAEAVADVDRVGRLTQALRLAETDKRSASADLRVRRQDVEAGKRDMETYTGIDDVASAIKAVEALLEAAQRVASEVAVSKDLQTRARAAETEIARFTQFREVHIPEAAFVMAARDLGTKVALARSLSGRLVQAKAVVNALVGIRDVVIPATPTSAVVARDDLRDAVVLRDRLMRARQAVSAAKAAAQALRDTALDTLSERAAQASKISRTLDLVRSFQERITFGRGEIETLRASLRSKGAQLAEAEIEVKSTLEALGVCPVCGTGVAGSSVGEAEDV